MVKRFDNKADDGQEKALRRGFTVPDGAVNLAWAKAPSLNPANNIIIIDTSKATGENESISAKKKKIAFANALGILEDENGNEIWDEEYPIISDVFSISEEDEKQDDYTIDKILPFVHVSRYFHIDAANLAYGRVEEFATNEIKIVKKNGDDHLDSNGQKRYKICIVAPNKMVLPTGSVQQAYRVYAFLDMDLDADELYLSYDKVELSPVGGIKSHVSDFKELINPRPYYKYIPEETDVIDLAYSNQKIFSSKPSNLKEQILGLPQPNTYGWKYFAPRKAIADPRIFQLFRWRLACEFTQPIIADPNAAISAPQENPIIRVGVVVPKGGDYSTTRANYFFYELNNTDYNFSKIQFLNPLKSPNLSVNVTDQATASYWHVDIDAVSLADLSKFDILVWAPAAATVDVAPYLPKINYFTETVGGTFIFESSSTCQFQNLPGATVGPSVGNSLIAPVPASSYVPTSSLRLYDATPENTGDTFNTFGQWKSWPPNVSNILNAYTDIGSILASADVIAGWNLSTDELGNLSGYQDIVNAWFQCFTFYDTNLYRPVLEGVNASTPTVPRKTMIHRKLNSGGNTFISTSCLFEDHFFEFTGAMSSRSLQIPSISQLSTYHQVHFRELMSSQVMQAEMKLRLNTMLFSTLNKPSPNVPGTAVLTTVNSKTQSTTVYSDWSSSWVINAANDVLTDKEKTDNNFSLLPSSVLDLNPVWQRTLNPKSCKQMILEKIKQLDPQNENPIFNKFETASKRYFLMITNPLVQTDDPEQLGDDSLPRAWTTAYTPAFEVPKHLGSFVVRDEMVSGTGVGEGKRIYPPKPFELQSSVSYINNATTQANAGATVTISGSYNAYYKSPDVVTTQQVWVPGTAGYMVDVLMHYNTDGANSRIGPYHQQGRFQRDYGIDNHSAVNYYNLPAVTTFPWAGYADILRRGISGGPLVSMVQSFLNNLIFFGEITGPGIAVNGYYDAATEAKVLEFQRSRQLRYPDGIVGVDFWAAMGYSLMYYYEYVPNWATNADPALVDFARNAFDTMRTRNISDDNTNSKFGIVSSSFDSPGTIKEGFVISINNAIPIYKLAIMPWCLGASNNLDIDWVDIQMNNQHNLELNYGGTYNQGNPGPIYNKSGGDGEWITITFPEVYGDTVIFRASQSGGMGIAYGQSRFIGLRDVAIYGKRFVSGSPGYYQDVSVTVPGSIYSVKKTFTYSQAINFTYGVPKTFSPIQAVLADASLDYKLSLGIDSVQWDLNSLQITKPNGGIVDDIPGFLNSNFRINTYTTFGKDVPANSTNFFYGPDSTMSNAIELTYFGAQSNILSTENFRTGPRIGGGVTAFWKRSKFGDVSPYAYTKGWINKDDGVQLICKADGTPFGFPVALPDQVSVSTHFARYRLDSFNTDQTLYYGIYDIINDEFITNSYGEPEISYYDYIRRGPQNIFIAVMTTYELDTNTNLPGINDPVSRPFKWAMPVYGVTLGLKSKIQIEPLSPDLSSQDLWALPIRTGSFAKQLTLRTRSAGSLTNFLKDYQGTTITAYYDVPEARTNASWSSVYGRPYTDVRGEVPIIIDDNIIQVRQYPILLAQIPTAVPSPADPWLPAFTVYKRASLNAAWSVVPFSSVEDYNAHNGTIILKDALSSNDPRLVKVDYTSERKLYNLKHDGTYRVNLNPYTNGRLEWINKPLYIYVVPEYITDATNNLIAASVNSRTLRLSTTSTIFAPDQVDYDPTAVLLGMVYISSAFNIEDLILLDTRKRGGGVTTALEDSEIYKIEDEAESYWDMIPKTATSYQKGGFVIVRLPRTITADFTYDQVNAAVERNIAVGVQFKLQDLQGNALTKDSWL